MGTTQTYLAIHVKHVQDAVCVFIKLHNITDSTMERKFRMLLADVGHLLDYS